jgi:hypothetical protein
LAEKKIFCIEGSFTILGGQELSLEKTFTEKERHTKAHSVAEATRIFATKFSSKLGYTREGIFLYAKVYEVPPPEKREKQLSIFDLVRS